AGVGVAALEKGKDVLLEKPMARTPGECDQLIAAARRTGRVLSIGHELRLSAQWGRIKAMIDTGDIGTPRYALFALFRFAYRRGGGGGRDEPPPRGPRGPGGAVPPRAPPLRWFEHDGATPSPSPPPPAARRRRAPPPPL